MKRRIRQVLAATLATSIIIVGTAGCAGGGASSPKELTLWSMWSKGEPNQLILADAISDFKKSTGITVNVVWKGRSPVSKLLPSLNSSTVKVDLVDSQNAELVNQLGATGNASDLTDVYSAKVPGESSTVGDVINHGYEADLKTDGKVYMVPTEVYTYAFYYNAAEHPELQAAPPATWDDLDALFAESKASGKAPIALEGSIAPFATFWTTALTLNSLGKGSFRAAVADKTGKTWLQPGYLAVAKKLQALVDNKYFIDDYLAAKYPAVQQEWAANKADYMYNGTWIPVETSPYAAKGFEYGSFAFPVVGDQKPVMQVAFNGMSVLKKSKNQDAAKKFIEFYLQKKYQDRIAADAKGIPARTDITPNSALAGAVKALNANETVIAGDNVPWDDYMTKVFNPANMDLFSGKINATAFVERLQKSSADYWANNDQ